MVRQWCGGGAAAAHHQQLANCLYVGCRLRWDISTATRDSLEVAPQPAIAESTDDVKGELIRELICLEAFLPAEATESDSEAQQGSQEDEAQFQYDESRLDSAETAVEALQDEESHHSYPPAKERPRVPTLETDEETLNPRLSRYGRAMRASADLRISAADSFHVARKNSLTGSDGNEA